MKIKLKKSHPAAITPGYATAGAACFDLHAIIDKGPVYIDQCSPATIRTGLEVEIPQGWVLKIYSRSGHGFKNGVRLANGTGIIDSDYRGEIMVRLVADAGGALYVKHGERIAQAMLEKCQQVTFEEVSELSETERGRGGFGSTGVA